MKQPHRKRRSVQIGCGVPCDGEPSRNMTRPASEKRETIARKLTASPFLGGHVGRWSRRKRRVAKSRAEPWPGDQGRCHYQGNTDCVTIDKRFAAFQMAGHIWTATGDNPSAGSTAYQYFNMVNALRGEGQMLGTGLLGQPRDTAFWRQECTDKPAVPPAAPPMTPAVRP